MIKFLASFAFYIFFPTCLTNSNSDNVFLFVCFFVVVFFFFFLGGGGGGEGREEEWIQIH